MRRELIRSRINHMLGKTVVKEIRIRVDEVQYKDVEREDEQVWVPPFRRTRSAA